MVIPQIKEKIQPRTFQSKGKWVEKPRISEVLICACNNKYIKTRKNQLACIKCIVRAMKLKALKF